MFIHNIIPIQLFSTSAGLTSKGIRRSPFAVLETSKRNFSATVTVPKMHIQLLFYQNSSGESRSLLLSILNTVAPKASWPCHQSCLSSTFSCWQRNPAWVFLRRETQRALQPVPFGVRHVNPRALFCSISIVNSTVNLQATNWPAETLSNPRSASPASSALI